MDFWILVYYSHCLFSHSQAGGHGFVLLSVPRLLVEHSPTWIIRGFWSAIHGQPNNHACRILFRVISNNNNKINDIPYAHLLHNRQCSRHFAYVISFNPVYSLMRDKNHYLHFTDKNIKAQKGDPTCWKSRVCRWAKNPGGLTAGLGCEKFSRWAGLVSPVFVYQSCSSTLTTPLASWVLGGCSFQ